jgi:hypothetical protein
MSQFSRWRTNIRSSLTVQSNARKMVKILTNQMTALGMHLVLKCILIADWSVEKMNPDTIQNRILLDEYRMST